MVAAVRRIAGQLAAPGKYPVHAVLIIPLVGLECKLQPSEQREGRIFLIDAVIFLCKAEDGAFGFHKTLLRVGFFTK